MAAAEVPIAVILLCKMNMSPNSKMLFFVIIHMAEMTASEASPLGSCPLFTRSLIHQVMTVVVCSVLMLLYIGFASVTKGSAKCVRLSFSILSRTWSSLLT